MCFTQAELASMWEEIKESVDPNHLVDASGTAGTFMHAAAERDTDAQQTLTFHTVVPYKCKDNVGTTFSYARTRLDVDALWGTWGLST